METVLGVYCIEIFQLQLQIKVTVLMIVFAAKTDFAGKL